METTNIKDTKQDSPELNSNENELYTKQNTIEFGGPFSAFSTLYRQDAADSGKLNKHISDINVDQNTEKLATPVLHPNFFRNNAGIFQDIPVAPAFAQIFQRRRRRENRPRRQRTTFTSEQTLKLELEYSRADYITRPRRYELAELLSLTESQIKIWFQNRRAKDKRIEKAHMDHQLRAMGLSQFHGQIPLSVTNHSLCSAYMAPPISLPFPPPLYQGVQTKPFKLL